jgi:hypothetical protein
LVFIQFGIAKVSDDNEQNSSSLHVSSMHKKLQIGLKLNLEEKFGNRVCAVLNFGLTDLPEAILKRIAESRNRAIHMKK